MFTELMQIGQITMYSYKGRLIAIKMNELELYAATKMNSHKHNAERRKSDTKEKTLNDSVYMKFKARQN